MTVELLAELPLTAVALSLAAEDGKPLCTPPGCRLMAVQTAQSRDRLTGAVTETIQRRGAAPLKVTKGTCEESS